MINGGLTVDKNRKKIKNKFAHLNPDFDYTFK